MKEAVFLIGSPSVLQDGMTDIGKKITASELET
jgi:hypothetical protein